MLPFRLVSWGVLFSIPAIFICVQSSAQIQAMIPKTSTRAVVVGISNYQNIDKLRFAHKDAEAFAQFLRSAAGGSVPEDHIKLLTNENATQVLIGKALSWLITESQANDLAIIYFSGHGDVESSIPNLGYLLAFDASKSTYMAGGAIPIYAIQSIITALSGKNVQVLVITDACKSGKLAGSETGGAKITAMALAAQFANEVKIMSCGPDEVSLESEDWGGGHSVFSYYLLDGLRGLADTDENREVTLREIERFLEDSVRRATVAFRRQTPAAIGNKDRVVATVDAATLAAIKLKNNPPKTEPGGGAAGKSGFGGQSVSDSAILKLYQAFELALRTGHLLVPEKGAAYSIYQEIKDHPAMRSYKNLMRNDLAAEFQGEAQKAIKDYLSADQREMRKRWAREDDRYQLYPKYLEKAAELLGEGHFSYTQLKAWEYYFSGLNLRLQGEHPDNTGIKDSLFKVAKTFQEKTLTLDSTAAYAYNELGLLGRRLVRLEESVVYFNKAIQFSPSWTLPWTNLCGTFSDLNQVEAAERCGLKALKLDSTFALTHYNLGYTYLLKKDTKREIYHYEKAIEYSGDYPTAYFNLGIAYFQNGDYNRAAQAFKAYETRVPNDPDGYQNLGEVSIKLGKVQEAEGYFLKAIALDAKYANAYIGLAKLWLERGDIKQSEKWLQNFNALQSDNPNHYYELAMVYHKKADVAILNLEKAFQYGFKDLEQIKNEPAFDSLRSQAGYKKLVKKYFPDLK